MKNKYVVSTCRIKSFPLLRVYIFNKTRVKHILTGGYILGCCGLHV